MKIFIRILIFAAIGLILFNASKISDAPLLEGNNLTALITIMALACAIVLLLILNTSKNIEKKVKNRK
ncbi:MAG TPA: hypothetical protein VFF15_06700 [Flavobacteriaceae bacterium]|nr:hypothetical protein [Flavobacteriaceae bacterium]